MEKKNVVDWLNYRLDLSNKKQGMVITDHDVTFIRNYIHHYKDVLVPPAQIIESVRHTKNWLFHLDFMINKLVEDFNIEVVWEDAGPMATFEVFINGQPQEMAENKRVKLYTP